MKRFPSILSRARGSPAADTRSVWIVTVALLAVITLVLAAGSILAVLLAAALRELGGPVAEWILDKGVDRLARRTWLLTAMILFFPLMRWAGWRGWKDLGWQAEPSAPAARLWLRGLVGGILSMALVAAWNLRSPLRAVDYIPGIAALGRWMVPMLLGALVTGVLEETLARGVLFRVLARRGRPWFMAVLTSLVFAHAHFINTAPESFEHQAWSSRLLAVMGDAFLSGPSGWREILRFMNLALMGMVLCAFVWRDGTLWRAVGLHTGWVMAIKTHSMLSGADHGARAAWWYAYRSDLTDGLLATVLLCSLLLAALLFIRNRSTVPRGRGKKS